MDLELSDEQSDLRDNFRSVLEATCPPALVRGVYENGDDGEDLRKQMIELGWPALSVPENAGGLGYGFVEVGLLAEELGRAAAPATLLATTSQFTPALIAGGADDLLAEVAEGRSSGSLAIGERGRFSLDAIRTAATKSDSGWTLSGQKQAVLAATSVDTYAVAAIDASTGEPGLFLVRRADAQVDAPPNLDPALMLANLEFAEAPARVLIEPGAGARHELERVAQQAAVAMALHSVGACRKIFEMTLEYAKIRKQYDRVIGSFQALKHRFAEMYLSVERSTALCYVAAVSIAEDAPDRAEAAHLAKAAAGDCQRLLAQDGLQLHGGLGFTWEQDLHFLLKRAKAGELLCGSSAYHRAALVELLGLARAGTRGEGGSA